MASLSPRQQSILNRVVDAHIETAQPVGSKFITHLYTEIYRDSYSPATVRNEMGLLEEMGYLTHPHTSAGRVPTDQGYRYYVDHSLQNEEVPSHLMRKISDGLNSSEEEDQAAELAASFLSQLADEVSVIVLEESTGSKKRRMKIFLHGSARLLAKPEFQDIEKLREVFRGFEEKVSLAGWLRERSKPSGVSVMIGHENEPQQAFRNCSVISTRYTLDGESSGLLAIIGPRRMKYSRAVPLVAQMGRMMNNLYDRMES